MPPQPRGDKMRYLATVAGSMILLLTVSPTFAQESSQPPSPPSSSEPWTPQPWNPHPSTKTASSSPIARVEGNLELLSDTQGVDFHPYLNRVLQAVRQNWYAIIPETARPPQLKSGTVAIQFVILPNGKIAGMQYNESSGDIALDRAAYGGITASAPFLPLPDEFHGPYLSLRVHFNYNPAKPHVPGQQSTPALPAKSPDH